MSGDLTTTSTPHTLLDWIILGATIGGSVVGGILTRTLQFSGRVGKAETEAAAAKTAADKAASDASMAKAYADAAATTAVAALRTELSGQIAAALAQAQAAASGARDPAALRVAIADALNADPRLRTAEQEITRLRDAADRGAENHGRTAIALARIEGALGTLEQGGNGR
jgi:hypothetical protein